MKRKLGPKRKALEPADLADVGGGFLGYLARGIFDYSRALGGDFGEYPGTGKAIGTRGSSPDMASGTASSIAARNAASASRDPDKSKS